MQVGNLNWIGSRMALVLICLVLLDTSGAQALQDQRIATVHAIGTGGIQGADMSASRKAAIADSLMAAITGVLIDIMPAKMAVGHFQVLSESILAKPDPYILNYEMLTESISAKQHRVMVKVNVSVESLRRSLEEVGIHLSQKEYPRLLLCIAEKTATAFDFQYWWGRQQIWVAGTATDGLQKVLAEKGFGLVQPVTSSLQDLPLELSVAETLLLGQQAGADVVIVGQAVAEAAPNTMGESLQSFRGAISARAYDVRSGQEMANTHQNSVTTADNPDTGSQEALQNAADLVAQDMAQQIAKAWFAQADAAAAVEIRVAGISGNVASFVKFRGALSTISGVDSVQRKEMQHDAAILMVDYQGNTRALADALMRQNFDTFGLNIAEPEGNRLEVQLIPR